MAEPTAASVRLEREGARATLLIDRPEKKNALNEAAWLAFQQVAAEIESDPEIAVVTVRGAGGVFSAGADISEFVALTSASTERRDAFADAVRDGEEAVARISKPTVAAIEGACVGGGCQIALACDIRLAAEGARFGVTPAKLGIAYPVVSTRRLVTTVGKSAAKDLLFTGRLISSDEALAIGLVDRVVPAGQLEAELESLLAQLEANSRYSLMVAKRTIDGLDDPASHAELDALWRGGFSGEDLKEGARAFLEKRKPAFSWRG
ncbi:enoyl-CoA hydratase/isomerase family protein [Chelatococcus sambhunathii]|uniref:Enoyl-CoA hydratase/isomerase family protein n=1 Tax=Chelatococcus sambhunathii TaxID=363953 RepID=A0ABU1DBP6_9HYPH|nr:enoyl-CoA hydratase/isomerase family protein [Chelatococcus sambhunathii]MDR4305527.1 enoyl-CoA hydratase/isomerase family protein [Chelatococcus sambhunathii]